MKNTILFTPSNEQILEMASTHPEMLENLKEKVLAELQKNALNYIQKRLQSRAESIYSNLFSTVEKRFFKAGNYSTPTGFDPSIEKSLTNAIETRFAEELEQEYETYIKSEEFKKALKVEVQRRIMTAVLKNLDIQIDQEAKKLITA